MKNLLSALLNILVLHSSCGPKVWAGSCFPGRPALLCLQCFHYCCSLSQSLCFSDTPSNSIGPLRISGAAFPTKSPSFSTHSTCHVFPPELSSALVLLFPCPILPHWVLVPQKESLSGKSWVSSSIYHDPLNAIGVQQTLVEWMTHEKKLVEWYTELRRTQKQKKQ